MARLKLRSTGKTAVLTHACGHPITTTNLFRVSMAEDLIECQRLRYLVFNCELGEGLDSSASALLDRDQCDYICDHLMVQDAATGKLVGAYRERVLCQGKSWLLRGATLRLRAIRAVSWGMLELGRACVHQEYRNTAVVHMALNEALREKYLVEPAIRTKPASGHDCKSTGSNTGLIRLPRLFRAYLEISARLCGPPAIDREFKTIDFLTCLICTDCLIVCGHAFFSSSKTFERQS